VRVFMCARVYMCGVWECECVGGSVWVGVNVCECVSAGGCVWVCVC